MSCEPCESRGTNPEVNEDIPSPLENEVELAADLHLVECRAAALVKHVMRIRHRLELRGVARSTAYWAAYVLGQHGGILPWCE